MIKHDMQDIGRRVYITSGRYEGQMVAVMNTLDKGGIIVRINHVDICIRRNQYRFID